MNTVGDYIRICGALATDSARRSGFDQEGLACLSYIAGVVAGYSGTLAVNAEYKLARESGVDRKSIASQVDSSAALHIKLDKAYVSSHFLCFSKDIGYYHIARPVAAQLEKIISLKAHPLRTMF